MAKRPAVRRGRKNPNAVITEATEKRSVEPDVFAPSKTEKNHTVSDVVVSPKTEDVQIFPMSGAVDRTAEFETRRALDKKLDAILGKRDEEEERQETLIEKKKEKELNSKINSFNQEKSDDSKQDYPEQADLKQAYFEQGGSKQVDLEQADSKPEITASGAILFDAVLPKGHGVTAVRRSASSLKNKSRQDEKDAKMLLDGQTKSLEDQSVSYDEHATPHTEPTAQVMHRKAHKVLHKTPKETRREGVPSEESLQGATQEAADQEPKDTATAKKKSVSIYDFKNDREAEEARIQAEVERRVSLAETELEPQVIISPKAAKRSRLTVLFVTLGIAALALFSIFLGINYDRMNRTLAKTNQELGFYKSLMNGEDVQVEESGEIAGSSGMTGTQVKKEDDVRRVYLTFDDGPSEVTVEILDILATYGVKATFFVNGKDDERSSYIYNRIVDEGHTLAMHGYSHDFDAIYASVESFSEDMHKLRNLLYDKTDGRVWCKYYRFPGGSSTTTAKTDMKELAAYLEREGIYYYDWNVYGGDDIPAATIISNIKANATKYKNVMILLHDAADKNATAMALPGIIEYLQALDNTVLLPVTDDTALVQHGMQ